MIAPWLSRRSLGGRVARRLRTAAPFLVAGLLLAALIAAFLLVPSATG